MYFDIIAFSSFDEGDECSRYLTLFFINLQVLLCLQKQSKN